MNKKRDYRSAGSLTTLVRAAFGEDANAVEDYLATLSRLFDPVYLRGEKPEDPAGMQAQWQQAKATIAAFREQYLTAKGDVNPSWRYLTHHADIATLYADTLIAFKGGEVSGKTVGVQSKQSIQNLIS